MGDIFFSISLSLKNCTNICLKIHCFLFFSQKKKYDCEDGAGSEDTRVGVIELSTGRTLTGEDAPFMSQLNAFLEAHPGWEAIESDSEDDDESEEENEEKTREGKFYFSTFFSFKHLHCSVFAFLFY